MPTPFRGRVADLFDAHYRQVARVLDRLSGEPELAADLAQEAFLRLLRRGALPDAPVAWLITVALNLLRNAKTKRARRRRLLGIVRAEQVHSEPPPAPADASPVAARARTRRAFDALPERDRRLLLLRAEGLAYTEIATALGIRETSVGTLLARARRAFREAYDDDHDTP